MGVAYLHLPEDISFVFINLLVFVSLLYYFNFISKVSPETINVLVNPSCQSKQSKLFGIWGRAKIVQILVPPLNILILSTITEKIWHVAKQMTILYKCI